MRLTCQFYKMYGRPAGSATGFYVHGKEKPGDNICLYLQLRMQTSAFMVLKLLFEVTDDSLDE